MISMYSTKSILNLKSQYDFKANEFVNLIKYSE